MNEQYVILPKKENGKLLQKYEILIYVCIRRYMNGKTLEAFPSLDTIKKDSGCSLPTIRKTIKNIVKKEYISLSNRGRQIVYKFNNSKSFEPFSYEFLDNKNLTKAEKLQILCTQQFMYKNNGIGKISWTDTRLAEETGLDRGTIAKNTKSLIAKGYCSQISLQSKDNETGLINKETIYHLNELGQAIVFKLNEHDLKLQKHEKQIEYLSTKIDELVQSNKDKDKDIELLRKALQSRMNDLIISNSFDM